MRWLQLNVALAPRQGPWRASERLLFAALAPLVQAERAAGLEAFWFARKDPGLRLRFGGERLPSGLKPRVESLLQSLGKGVVDSWYVSTYEPEVFLFGGRSCLELIHRYFDRDTSAWMSWASAQSERRLPITSSVLTLAVAVDLFERCIPAREEVWDVWCNLQRIYGTSQRPLDAPRVGLRDLERLGGPRLRPITEAYARANAEFAAGLDALLRQGRLGVGPRALLPSVFAFTWNRHRVESSMVARLAQAMVAAYDPRRGLAGVSA